MTHPTPTPNPRIPTEAEILELLISYYFLKEIKVESDVPIENLKSLKLISLLTDDIILGLCKLGDADNRTASFFSQFNSIVHPTRNDELGVRITHYVQRTKGLRRHQNWRIAHLSSEDRGKPTPLIELFDLVREAVEIWDVMSGDVKEYRLLEIDLREAVLRYAPSSRFLPTIIPSGFVSTDDREENVKT